MIGTNNPRQRPGRPVSAGVMNRAATAAEQLGRIRGGAGIGQTSVAGQPLFQVLGDDFIRVGLAKAQINRMSGVTPGTGQVSILRFDKPSYGEVAIGDLDVVNPYRHADCPAGAICWIVKVLGVWHLLNWDCPDTSSGGGSGGGDDGDDGDGGTGTGDTGTGGGGSGGGGGDLYPNPG